MLPQSDAREPRRIVALMLAAGGAHRFGTDKLVASLADGTPLAVAAIRSLRPAVDEVIAVVRARSQPAKLLAREGARLVVASSPEHGVGRSVAAGVASLMGREPPFTGCIVAFADMPLVRSDTVARLAAALHQGGSIVAPAYRGTRGFPVAFASTWFAALSALRGEDGVRHLLAVHRRSVQTVVVDDPGILTDVDHPSDLEVLLADS